MFEIWSTLASHPGLTGSIQILANGIHWSPILQEQFDRLDLGRAEASNSFDLAMIQEVVKETSNMEAANR